MKQKIKIFSFFIIYLMIRIMKSPSFWKGIPNFKNWMEHETKENFKRDLSKLLFIGIEITLFLVFNWFWFLISHLIWLVLGVLTVIFITFHNKKLEK